MFTFCSMESGICKNKCWTAFKASAAGARPSHSSNPDLSRQSADLSPRHFWSQYSVSLMKNTRISLMINKTCATVSQVIQVSAWYSSPVTAAYCRAIEIDMSMFSNHRAPRLLSLIIQTESELVFDQPLALYPGNDKKKRQAAERRGQTPPCIYPCISISLMIIHVQSL